MKHSIFAIIFACVAVLPVYGDYAQTLAKAEAASSLDQRMDLWIEAAAQTSDERKKLELYEKGFDLAKRIKDKKHLPVFAELLRKSPAASESRKASAFYEYLMAGKLPGRFDPSGIQPAEFEEFLAMPGITPKQEKDAMMRLTTVYHNTHLWYKEVEIFKKLLEHPETNSFERQDLYVNLSNLYLEMNRMNEALESLKAMLKMKTLAPTKRARAYVLMGDILLKGYGWYYRPNPEQYKELCGYYRQAMNTKKVPAGIYSDALIKLVEAAYNTKRYQETINLAEQYGSLNNKKLNQISWTKIMDMKGNSLQKLERYREAIVVFEQLYKYKYKLADTCMSLGANYYGNGDYSMALGMYDEAIVELGMADDARPAQCKYWVNRLKWFSNGKKILDDLYAARVKRLNEEAIAAGKGPVVKERQKDSLRPFDSGKPEVKKKPQTIEELMKGNEEEDLLEGGLDLE